MLIILLILFIIYYYYYNVYNTINLNIKGNKFILIILNVFNFFINLNTYT